MWAVKTEMRLFIARSLLLVMFMQLEMLPG